MSPELDAWDRLAAVLDLQLDALQGAEPDMERFQELARSRAHIQATLDRLRRGVPAREPTATLRACMEGCRDRDQAILARLAHLRKETAGAIQRSGDRTPARSGYLAGAHAVAGERPKRIDLRS